MSGYLPRVWRPRKACRRGVCSGRRCYYKYNRVDQKGLLHNELSLISIFFIVSRTWNQRDFEDDKRIE